MGKKIGEYTDESKVLQIENKFSSANYQKYLQ